MNYSLVLVPAETELSEQLCHYVHTVFGDCAAEYMCDGASHPHITVAQVAVAESSELTQLRAATAQFISTMIPVQFGGMYLDPKDVQRVSTGLRLESNVVLQQLHEKAIDAIERVGLRINNKNRNAYWPHLTLAHMAILAAINIAAVPDLSLFSNSHLWRVELGRAGAGWNYLGND